MTMLAFSNTNEASPNYALWITILVIILLLLIAAFVALRTK